MSELRGSCLCNKIKYAIKQDNDQPAVPGTAICSCTDCQKETGGAHNTVITVRLKNMTWSDPENVKRIYSSPAESGNNTLRHFCGNCGSSLAHLADNDPEEAWFTIGTLDRDIKMQLKSPQIESRLPFTTETVTGKRFHTLPGHPESE